MMIWTILLFLALVIGTNGKPSPQQLISGRGSCGLCIQSRCPQINCNYGVKVDTCGCCQTCQPPPPPPPCGASPCPQPVPQPCNVASCPPPQPQPEQVMYQQVQAVPQPCGCGTNCVTSTTSCIHGPVINPTCGCCQRCAAGPGEMCGNGCGRGLQCQNNICMSVTVMPSMPMAVGRPMSSCGCASNGCSPNPQGCHFGIAVSSSCSCCKTCASGPGMPCVLHAGGSNCGHGLSCVQSTCQTTIVQNSAPAIRNNGCGCGTGCATPQTNCMYGQVTVNSCGCCKQCASGMGQPCGYGCGQGLQCMQNTCQMIPVVQTMPAAAVSSPGCGGCGAAPITVPNGCNCAATSCPAISAASCQYGMVSDACGCCNVCAAAPGGSCGAAVGVSICTQNHFCNRGACSPCSRCGK